MASLFVPGCINAQKLPQLSKALGGMSLGQIQVTSAVRAQVSHGGNFHKACICTPKSIPYATRRVTSFHKLFRNSQRMPRLTTSFSIQPFESIALEALYLPRAMYVVDESLFLPANSYIVRLPDGELHFSTPSDPFNKPAQDQLQARFETADAPATQAAQAEVDNTSQPDTAGQDTAQPDTAVQDTAQPDTSWPGQSEYVDLQELTRDVIQFNQPFVHYDKSPFGPVRLYTMPKGVVYTTAQGTQLVMDPDGIYGVILQEKSGQVKFINKAIYRPDTW